MLTITVYFPVNHETAHCELLYKFINIMFSSELGVGYSVLQYILSIVYFVFFFLSGVWDCTLELSLWPIERRRNQPQRKQEELCTSKCNCLKFWTRGVTSLTIRGWGGTLFWNRLGCFSSHSSSFQVENCGFFDGSSASRTSRWEWKQTSTSKIIAFRFA